MEKGTEPKVGLICRLCDRKFMMYLWQESAVDPVVELSGDIEAMVSEYNMKVRAAQALEEEALELENQLVRLRIDEESA